MNGLILLTAAACRRYWRRSTALVEGIFADCLWSALCFNCFVFNGIIYTIVFTSSASNLFACVADHMYLACQKFLILFRLSVPSWERSVTSLFVNIYLFYPHTQPVFSIAGYRFRLTLSHHETQFHKRDIKKKTTQYSLYQGMKSQPLKVKCHKMKYAGISIYSDI
jgi:hypothetical protein